MAEVGFYHLTRSTLEQALPALLGRTLDAGRRAVVRCGDEGRVKWLDDALWRATDPVWLPHGTRALGHESWQPIWLTAGEDVPNGATFLFLIDGMSADGMGDFERVFDLFDGHDENAVAAARQRWKACREAGHTLTYWQQQAKGWTRR
ncbi:DNA polymerase III subunit chi [Gluconacetobacter entanii]|uniref:DNA polymerase III subunit chi n=1 Tax=Gluconacetobacter entanii TaxID=108528 RepID=A0A318PW23_9PROT|nr:DNA polymerase III subunit chi [Gluconacetobacter entanii]MCE2577145.1 DNA polymerase III subunit chi [Komagataeibacter sp. FNDCR1]MBY4639366.1 DNA polymerase III subunit chi [Gluconacetobacter entanii]MCW4580284.1 DNA polymerase III subunit chi [Gluconacetobacter entanii]MCW4583650.1 DNA polymerase III subunit chi [Gluconacetobacter entanii]MCW4586960.1 DNA polymerase III subunit chi [Gluconacetobacter entanii]